MLLPWNAYKIVCCSGGGVGEVRLRVRVRVRWSLRAICAQILLHHPSKLFVLVEGGLGRFDFGFGFGVGGPIYAQIRLPESSGTAAEDCRCEGCIRHRLTLAHQDRPKPHAGRARLPEGVRLLWASQLGQQHVARGGWSSMDKSQRKKVRGG